MPRSGAPPSEEGHSLHGTQEHIIDGRGAIDKDTAAATEAFHSSLSGPFSYT